MTRSESSHEPEPKASSSGPGAPRAGVSRREFLTSAALGAGIGALGGGAAGYTLGASGVGLGEGTAGGNAVSEQVIDITQSPYGEHQAGIDTPETAHGTYLAYHLKPETDREAIRRMLRILTQDIAALTSGRAPLADTEPELAGAPASLTVTVGFGAELIRRVNPDAVPEWLKPIEPFSRDQLDDKWGEADLLLSCESNDTIALAHAVRMLGKSVATFATPAWVQTGFRGHVGRRSGSKTMRNLMGQVDGTVNPKPGGDEQGPSVVWLGPDAGWMEHGTALVFRRIHMNLDTWDQVDPVGREDAVGRKLSNGAPLTGSREFDEVDFDAKTDLGFPVIPDYSHIRRAHSFDNPDERILRRAANYMTEDDAGLLFICFQKDPRKQFSAIQRRLDELDLLNQWIVHIGSAVFAIPPGFKHGEMLGDSLFATLS